MNQKILFLCLFSLPFSCLSNNESCWIAPNVEGWKCRFSGQCLWRDWLCDGDVQCKFPDSSDEEEACHLFPETECLSWNGRKHQKLCFESNDCVEFSSECESKRNLSSQESCLGKAAHWRCKDGLCILLKEVCDGKRNCLDNSDEEEGCNLFPDSKCKSRFGLHHVLCSDDLSSNVCTLPELIHQHNCRVCDSETDWRCNDGKCIPMSSLYNGKYDCLDGSDERNYQFLRWETILIAAFIITFLGSLLSFLYRRLNAKKHFFFCFSCDLIRRGENHRFLETEETLSAFSRLSDPDSILPNKLITLLESSENWFEGSLNENIEKQSIALYATVHQNSLLYKNFYTYLVLSHSVLFSQVFSLLTIWENDFHGHNSLDVEACWRLHLGSSEVLKVLNDSSKASPKLLSKLYSLILPLKNHLRSFRLTYFSSKGLESFYKALKILYYFLQPFCASFLFTFDALKDGFLIILMILTLNDSLWRNGGEGGGEDVYFVLLLIAFLLLSFLFSAFLFSFISVSYSSLLFETCAHVSQKSFQIPLFKLLSFLLSPLMPSFILGNYAFYSEKKYSTSRNLGVSESLSSLNRVLLFHRTLFYRRQSFLFRKIYSNFRVVQGVMCSLIVTSFLLHLLTSPNSIKLSKSFGEKLHHFFFRLSTLESLSSFGSLFSFPISLFNSTQGTAQAFILSLNVLFSFFMVVSALLRYVNSCKLGNMSYGARTCFAAYIGAHTLFRLTVLLSLLSSLETLGSSLYLGILYTLFLLHFLLIYAFKSKYIEDFGQSLFLDKVIHCLANTVVVIPFVKSLKHDFVGDLIRNSSAFIKKKENSVGLASYDEIDEKLEDLWWKNPKDKLSSSQMTTLLPNVPLEEIQVRIQDLESNGVIHKTLYHPRKTKFEYFWCLTFHSLFNLLAFFIEVFHGGQPSRIEGMAYYTWDIRCGTFVMGLVFLCLYYVKYHGQRNLLDKRLCGFCWKNCFVFLGCKKDVSLAAKPRTSEIKKLCNANHGSLTNVTTQTEETSEQGLSS